MATKIERKTFWSGNSPFQKQHDEMWEKFVPQQDEVNFKKQGLPENKELEKVMEGVRSMGRIYYDYFNNGSCNTLEIVSENNGWDGDREVIDEETGEEVEFEEWDVVEGFDEYYQKCVDSICAVLGNEYESKLLEICSEFALHNRWMEDEMEDIIEELHKIAWGVYKGTTEIKEQPKDDTISKEEFKRYLEVQKEGRFNMLSSNARELVGLHKDKYNYLLINYSKLSNTYGISM